MILGLVQHGCVVASRNRNPYTLCGLNMSLFTESSIRNLIEARREFARLLAYRDAPESDWQSLFTAYPFILSSALPLKIAAHDVRALARPGKSDPDFVFYPNKPTAFPTYGVIELKRPKDKIISVPRKEIVILSRNAATAIKQAEFYLAHLADRLLRRSQALMMGGTSYIFVIMGLSEELQRKIVTEVLSESFRKAVPKGCQIIPYDILFERFNESLPTRFILLSPYFFEPNDLNLEEERFLDKLVSQNSGLLVDGVNSDNVAKRLSRAGGGFREESIPGEKGHRCVYFLEDYYWGSDSAPAGITTKMALDVLTFSKESLLDAIRAGFEGTSLEVSGTRLWDYGIWEDALADFDRVITPEVKLNLRVNLETGSIEVYHDQTLRPKRWSVSELRSLTD
jgi:hypothetical protein